MQAARARRVRYEGHHGDPARGELVDRSAYPWVVERDDGDALIGRRQVFQRAGQHIRIEHIDMEDVDEAALAGKPVCGALDLLGQIGHEAVAAGRQHKGEAKALPARETRRRHVGAVAQLGDGGLDTRDGLGAHALSPIDDAVDGRERNAGGPRDILERGANDRLRRASAHSRAAHSMPRVINVRISGTSSS